MAIPHASPGMPSDLWPAEESQSEAESAALVKGERFEAIRMVIAKEYKVRHNHQVEGTITVDCLEGGPSSL